MKSYILITDNSEDSVAKMLNEVIELKENEELIIFDNKSTDNTVSIIVSLIGTKFTDNRYKFYINLTRQSYEELKEKALSIAIYEPIIINEVVEC